MPPSPGNDMSREEFCCMCCKEYLKEVVVGFILTGIIVLILWLSLRPKAVKFYVTYASLAEFDFENNTLHYDLAINFSFQNHNRRMDVYYEYIEVQTLFQDVRFDLETLAPFYQGHKNTTVLSHVLQGQQPLVLTADQASEQDKEKSNGVYDIQVKLYLKTRFNFWGEKREKDKNEITCDLQIPLTSSNNGTSSAGAFQTTKCKGDLSYGYQDAVQ